MPTATGVAPTLSQIEAWGTEHLEAAATQWSQTAETWGDAFTRVYRQVAYPHGSAWEGAAAEAAALRTGTDRRVVLGATDHLRSAVDAARVGANEISGARQLALQAVNAARAAGFSVGEDLSVNGSVGGTPALRAARLAEGQRLAAVIRARAAALVAVDGQVASKVSAAIGAVKTVKFDDPDGFRPRKRKPQIQAVDYGPRPTDPVITPSGPSGDDIRRVLDKLPQGNKPWIREVRSQQDLDNLWRWIQQNGVERPGGYGNEPGVMKNLPDGTIVGRRDAADSTKLPALEVNVPGKGAVKVHVNPRGGIPEIPAPLRPTIPEGPIGQTPVKPPPLEEVPRIGGTPTIGGPGTPIGPTPVPGPHSIPHPPIAGEDDLGALWEYRE